MVVVKNGLLIDGHSRLHPTHPIHPPHPSIHPSIPTPSTPPRTRSRPIPRRRVAPVVGRATRLFAAALIPVRMHPPPVPAVTQVRCHGPEGIVVAGSWLISWLAACPPTSSCRGTYLVVPTARRPGAIRGTERVHVRSSYLARLSNRHRSPVQRLVSISPAGGAVSPLLGLHSAPCAVILFSRHHLLRRAWLPAPPTYTHTPVRHGHASRSSSVASLQKAATAARTVLQAGPLPPQAHPLLQARPEARPQSAS